jgi:hypothetical protein
MLLMAGLVMLGDAAQAASFAFVLLGEGRDGQPVPMARAVVENASTCPDLALASGERRPMTPRARPAFGQFDGVLVCEALYPWGQSASIAVGAARHDLPVVRPGVPRRVVVLGDSGCRGQAERRPQSCVGDGYDRIWPFGTLSVEGARDRPDLIVHVGDYNYRGTPHFLDLPASATGYARQVKVRVFDTGDLDNEDEDLRFPIGPGYFSQNFPGSPRPDNWPDWRDDFFIPSSRLLVAAPWVFTRGNHELCSRAGPGWFYLLDAGSELPGGARGQRACPPQLPATWRPGHWPDPALPFDGQTFPTLPTPPFRLKLGGLDIVVFDSSDAGDAVIYAREHYIAQYARVATMLADGTPTWLFTHRPIWGVVHPAKGIPGPDPNYGFINVTQQLAVAAAFPDGMPSNLKTVISGHMHRFQAIGFDGKRPPQLAVGTGGMELSSIRPIPSPDDPKAPIRVPGLDGTVGFVVGLSDFAAMDMRVEDKGDWSSALVGIAGQTLATCDSRWPIRGSGRSVCALK